MWESTFARVPAVQQCRTKFWRSSGVYASMRGESREKNDGTTESGSQI